jgi:DNA-directed RNA polymerase subunit N (RpoN/RPB10)
MIIPPRCYTCGKILADKYEYYKKELIRKKLSYKKDNNTDKDPLMIDISIDDVIKTVAGEIMDELGLTRICCRKVMLTSIDIIDEI